MKNENCKKLKECGNGFYCNKKKIEIENGYALRNHCSTCNKYEKV